VSRNLVRIDLEGDQELMQAIKEAPALFEKHIKRQLRIPTKSLIQTIRGNLKQYVKSSWILEKSITTTVEGNTQKHGKIFVRMSISDKRATDRGNPKVYAYRIEHGNKLGRGRVSFMQRSRKGNFYMRTINNSSTTRTPRPFMNQPIEDFITNESVLTYMDNAIQDAMNEWNESK